MARAPYMSRFRCAHAGCPEVAVYESATRREQSETYSRYHGKWLCVRHSSPNEVLSVGVPKLTTFITSKRLFTDDGADIGLFWGRQGFVSGPGFKAWAKDFPEGSRLKITAEVLPPLGDNP